MKPLLLISLLLAWTSLQAQTIEIKPKAERFAPHNPNVPVKTIYHQMDLIKESKGEKIEIIIWDEAGSDSDAISIEHNGDIILNNYIAIKKRNVIPVAVTTNEHHFRFIAEGTGMAGPNTIAVKVRYGDQTFSFNLEGEFNFIDLYLTLK